MRTKFAAAIVVVAALAGVVAWRENQRAQEATQARARLSAVSVNTAAAQHDADARLATAEREQAELRTALGALSQTPPSPAAAFAKKISTDAATNLADWFKAEEERQKDPQVQLQLLAAARARLVARYGALYWKLKLTPDQIAQFETIAARRTEQNNDLMAAVLAQGVTFGDKDFANLYWPLSQKVEEAYRAREKALLGEAGYQQFADYERTLSARTFVQSLAGAAVATGTPFSSELAEQLVAVVADGSAEYRKGRNVNTLDIQWDQVDARAREILSREQMEAFQTLEPARGGGRSGLEYNRALNEAQSADRKQATAPKPAG